MTRRYAHRAVERTKEQMHGAASPAPLPPEPELPPKIIPLPDKEPKPPEPPQQLPQTAKAAA